jgi:uncharacterized protein YndB with AHSA1/START domain
MAINSVRTALSPDEVFEHLLDPWEYPSWLLGASDMRAVDDDWPEVGSSFHHRVGFGPVNVNDRSQILELDRPRKLVLKVRATPLVQGIVTFTVEALSGGGSVLWLQEEPAIPGAEVLRPVLDPPTHLRNQRSLSRLADLMLAAHASSAASG